MRLTLCFWAKSAGSQTVRMYCLLTGLQYSAVFYVNTQKNIYLISFSSTTLYEFQNDTNFSLYVSLKFNKNAIFTSYL